MNLYRIATKQNLKVLTFNLFGKIKFSEYGYVVRGERFYYRTDVEEALARYTTAGRTEYEGVTGGWGDWIEHSDNVNVMTYDCKYDIVSNEPIILDVGEPNIQHLKENMSAEDFKRWFWNNNRLEKEV